jgi:hypothetical protein
MRCGGIEMTDDQIDAISADIGKSPDHYAFMREFARAILQAARATPADHIVDANKKVDADSVPVAIYQITSESGWLDVPYFQYLTCCGPARRIVYVQSPQPEVNNG